MTTDREALTDEALWDFANDLLDAWNIEDENPPSLVEQFRDLFVARFSRQGSTVPTPVLEREDDAPSGVAGHDEQCEAEYLAEATGWLPCGRAGRATEGVREALDEAFSEHYFHRVSWRCACGWVHPQNGARTLDPAFIRLHIADAILREFHVTKKGDAS